MINASIKTPNIEFVPNGFLTTQAPPFDMKRGDVAYVLYDWGSTRIATGFSTTDSGNQRIANPASIAKMYTSRNVLIAGEVFSAPGVIYNSAGVAVYNQSLNKFIIDTSLYSVLLERDSDIVQSASITSTYNDEFILLAHPRDSRSNNMLRMHRLVSGSYTEITPNITFTEPSSGFRTLGVAGCSTRRHVAIVNWDGTTATLPLRVYSYNPTTGALTEIQEVNQSLSSIPTSQRVVVEFSGDGNWLYAGVGHQGFILRYSESTNNYYIIKSITFPIGYKIQTISASRDGSFVWAHFYDLSNNGHSQLLYVGGNSPSDVVEILSDDTTSMQRFCSFTTNKVPKKIITSRFQNAENGEASMFTIYSNNTINISDYGRPINATTINPIEPRLEGKSFLSSSDDILYGMCNTINYENVYMYSVDTITTISQYPATRYRGGMFRMNAIIAREDISANTQGNFYAIQII